MELENALPGLRGFNDRNIKREDFVQLFSDFLNLVSYKRVSAETSSYTIDNVYTNNQSFWRDALSDKCFEGMRIRLEHSHVVEWLPSSPGRYFTEDATESRRIAMRYVDSSRSEYVPLGKERMILGGVGSIRLAAKTIENKTYYFLGATSSGISHEGIPIALAESDYRRIISSIKDFGGCFAHVEGALRILPTSISPLRYLKNVPRYYLAVDDLQLLGSPTKELLSTVAIMFSSNYESYDEDDLFRKGHPTRFTKTWSYASFHPSKKNEELIEAVAWLEDYVMRYSSVGYSAILSDFDEHYQHFDNPIEFSIGSLFKGSFDIERLQAYGQYYGITINIEEMIMGDKFENIHNATIINRSIVEKAFNKVRSEHDEETAQALKQVAELIEKSQNPEAAENFNSFNEELQKSEPKKSVLRSLWGGVTAALPSILQMADVVGKISKLFVG